MRKFLYVFTCIYNQMRVYLTIQNITKQIQWIVDSSTQSWRTSVGKC